MADYKCTLRLLKRSSICLPGQPVTSTKNDKLCNLGVYFYSVHISGAFLTCLTRSDGLHWEWPKLLFRFWTFSMKIPNFMPICSKMQFQHGVLWIGIKIIASSTCIMSWHWSGLIQISMLKSWCCFQHWINVRILILKFGWNPNIEIMSGFL